MAAALSQTAERLSEIQTKVRVKKDELGNFRLVTFLRRIPDAGFVFARIWLKHRRVFRAARPPLQQNRFSARAAKTTREARALPNHFMRSNVFWSNSKSEAPPVLSRVVSIHFFSNEFFVGLSF